MSASSENRGLSGVVRTCPVSPSVVVVFGYRQRREMIVLRSELQAEQSVLR